MSSPRRSLVVVTLAYLVLMATGTVVAIAEDLPHAFGHRLFGGGDPDRVAWDWLFGLGTALSPPAGSFLVLGACVFLVAGKTRLRTLGVVGTLLGGFGGTVGALGEPLTWEVVTTEGFDLLKASVAWGGVVLAMTMWALSVSDLLSRRAAVRP